MLVTCDDGMWSSTDENKALIASLGGVEMVLLALRNHASHVGIQKSGLYALGNLAKNGVCACVWGGGGG